MNDATTRIQEIGARSLLGPVQNVLSLRRPRESPRCHVQRRIGPSSVSREDELKANLGNIVSLTIPLSLSLSLTIPRSSSSSSSGMLGRVSNDLVNSSCIAIASRPPRPVHSKSTIRGKNKKRGKMLHSTALQQRFNAAGTAPVKPVAAETAIRRFPARLLRSLFLGNGVSLALLALHQNDLRDRLI